MKTIYKFPLIAGQELRVRMPKGAEVISAKCQKDIVLYALVDTDREPEDRVFVVYGTGEETANPQRLIFVDTVSIGPFVWHIFELRLGVIPV